MPSKVIEIHVDLKPTRISFEDVGTAEYKGGAYILGFLLEKNFALVMGLSLKDPSSLTTALDSFYVLLQKEVPTADAKVKIVGDEPERVFAKNYFYSKGIAVVGDAPIRQKGARVYFIPETGKIRIENVSIVSQLPKVADPKRVRNVFIVDDSGTMRKILKAAFESSPLLRVVGETGRPSQAEELIRSLKPDVITLDIHMPEMDGITLLKKLMEKFSVPIVMISSVSYEEGTQVLNALELGAVDYIEKPKFDAVETSTEMIVEKVLIATDAKVQSKVRSASPVVATKLPIDVPIVIGSSTGGTEALRVLLTSLPKEIPPILIVQHIPALFSEALAKRLNDLCPFEVSEAKHLDALKPGRVLIAPGDKHMTVKGSCKVSAVHLSDLPSGYRHKPAVDVLFDSAVKVFGGNCTAVILTGMGTDGANGMKSLKNAGAYTIVQDEATCVVYGMPKAALALGVVDKIVPLTNIASELGHTPKKKKVA